MIQQPNVATFARVDDVLLQQMSDNDDSNKNSLERNAKGLVALASCSNLDSASGVNYSGILGVYQKHTSVEWLPVWFGQPGGSNISVNLESNRHYKFIMHFDYVWASNNYSAGATGETGRIEIRVRDMTHRRDVMYWTNYMHPDYNMGGTYVGDSYLLRDNTYNTNVNIWQWAQSSSEGSVPSSCHATRVLGCKSSGASVFQVQYRPMNAYGGVVPPLMMDCTTLVGTRTAPPASGLPLQFKIDGVTTSLVDQVTYDVEALSQFGGYFSVEDCGPMDMPAGVEPGISNDNSISPLFEAFENHPYDSSNASRP